MYFIIARVVRRLYNKFFARPPVFTLGKRPAVMPVVKRHRRRRRPKKNHTSTDRVKNTADEYFYALGEHINSTCRDSPHVCSVSWYWFVWTPRRKLHEFLDLMNAPPDPLTFEFAEPEPEPEPELTPEPTVKKIRRAKRPFGMLPDSPADTVSDRCKICMVNKKVIVTYPCGHLGICNTCCEGMYRKKFMLAPGTNRRPYLIDCVPLPPPPSATSDFGSVDEIIQELTTPRYHITKKCIFCKTAIQKFRLTYSV